MLADDQYENIIVIARKPIGTSNPKLIEKTIDFDSIESFKTNISIDDVYCALGTTIKTAGSQQSFYKVDNTYVVNLGKWCVLNNVKRYLIVSAMGADPKSGIFYNRVKGEMEEAASKLSIAQIQVFRPSLLMGNRTEKRGGEKIAQTVMGLLGFIFVGKLLNYKGIHVDVVARSMITAAKRDVPGFTVYESGEMQKNG